MTCVTEAFTDKYICQSTMDVLYCVTVFKLLIVNYLYNTKMICLMAYGQVRKYFNLFFLLFDVK